MIVGIHAARMSRVLAMSGELKGAGGPKKPLSIRQVVGAIGKCMATVH